jgi:hypothetical protein
MNGGDHIRAKYEQSYKEMRERQAAELQAQNRRRLSPTIPISTTPVPAPFSSTSAGPNTAGTLADPFVRARIEREVNQERVRYERAHPQSTSPDYADLVSAGLIGAKMSGASDITWRGIAKAWFITKLTQKLPALIGLVLCTVFG